ncbi:hypothetical protein [Embleya hyalina]|nr:hypothetical protein [Embleya hyalina]
MRGQSVLRDAEVLVYFDGVLIAGIVLDDVQDSYPHYLGTIVDGPGLGPLRTFVERFAEADPEFDYCPHHPHEGPYEESDTARYVEALSAIGADCANVDWDDPWLAPWRGADESTLRSYLRFLDFRLWRATNRAGELLTSIALPVSLDLESRRFVYNPYEGDE